MKANGRFKIVEISPFDFLPFFFGNNESSVWGPETLPALSTFQTVNDNNERFV